MGRFIIIAAISSAIFLAGAAVAIDMKGNGGQAKVVNVSDAVEEIARVVAEIDQIEAASIELLKQPPDNQVQKIELLGKLLLFDKKLSVNRNDACAFCQTPETGFEAAELRSKLKGHPPIVRMLGVTAAAEDLHGGW